MSNEDLKREISRREASINKLDKEIAELKQLLNNASKEEKKGIEKRLATKEAKKELESSTLVSNYNYIISNLNLNIMTLDSKIRKYDKQSNEYASAIIERNNLIKERDEYVAKLNRLKSTNTRRIINVEEPKEEKTANQNNGKKSHKGLMIAGIALLAVGTLGVTSCAASQACIACEYYNRQRNNDEKRNVSFVETPTSTITNSNGEELELGFESTETPAEVEATTTPIEVEATAEPVSSEFGTYGDFTDVNDPEQLEARAQWYLDTYNLGNSITLEQMVDALSIFNGELPVDGRFENEDLMLTNNRIAYAFIFANSTFDDVKNGTRKFVPIAPLFPAGSYENACAAEFDAVMEPAIEAMNNHDDEAFVRYAKEFGALLRDQHFLVSNTNEHKGVRGLMPSTQNIMLYCLEYAQYTGNIMEYGIERNIDVCFLFCYDHETGEPVYVSLANFMATLDMVPMNEWDAVIQRAGLTPEDIEALGRGSVEDSMPVLLVRESLEHFKAKKQELAEQKTLNLG